MEKEEPLWPDLPRLTPIEEEEIDRRPFDPRLIRKPSRWFWISTVIACVLAMAVDSVPGLFMSGLLCPCISFFIVGVAGMVWMGAGLYSLKEFVNRKIVATSFAIAFLTVTLCLLHLPRRIVFWSVHTWFESHLENAPIKYKGESLGWVGCYYIDRYGADEEGGVFFRTASHPEFPGAISYGFAFRPHRESCPFGRSGYSTTWIFGDWYWFEVSNY